MPSWIQYLLTEKTGYLLYRPLLTLDLVFLFVFRESSTCVIILVGLSVLLCPPRDFPLVFLLVFFAFFAGSAPFVKDWPIRVPTLHHLGIMSHVDHDFGASPLCFLA